MPLEPPDDVDHALRPVRGRLLAGRDEYIDVGIL